VAGVAAMRILALDTAGAACSVAACIGHAVVAARHEPMPTGQAERIVPMLAEVMAEARWAWEAVELIVPTLGPGTFTGIRAGLAAARGLALAADRPALGVSTLEAMAAAAGPGPCLCLLRGRGATVFAQRFAVAGEPKGPPAAMALPDALALAAGDDRIVVEHAAPVAAASALPVAVDAAAAARAALARIGRGERPGPGSQLHPLYLREADARPDAGRPLVRREVPPC
jgi:tRNA threonylcarbamoyladenosine biosynthesis protein TsaB